MFTRMNRPPEDSELIIRSPYPWMHGYESIAGEYHAYWKKEEQLAAQIFPKDPDTTDGWYRDGRLWVHRQPADPSDQLRRDLAEHSISADFTTLTTLYPYLAIHQMPTL